MVNAQANKRIDIVESTLNKKMDNLQTEISQQYDNLRYSISRLTNQQQVQKKGKFPSLITSFGEFSFIIFSMYILYC